MSNHIFNFPTIFWGEENSTQVKFYISNKLPNDKDVITCMCAVFYEDKILLVRPIRGWGLPGGHIEKGETPEDCIIRECFEEAGVLIKHPKIIGYWKAGKLKKLDSNKLYPNVGYQLLYMAEADKIMEFKKVHETSDRKFLEPNKVKNIHHAYEDFEEILKYIMFL